MARLMTAFNPMLITSPYFHLSSTKSLDDGICYVAGQRNGRANSSTFVRCHGAPFLRVYEVWTLCCGPTILSDPRASVPYQASGGTQVLQPWILCCHQTAPGNATKTEAEYCKTADFKALAPVAKVIPDVKAEVSHSSDTCSSAGTTGLIQLR